VSARDRACVHKNGHASPRTTQHSHHLVERHHRGRRLGSPRRNAGELSSAEEQEEQGWGLILFLSKHVRGCTGAWTQARVRACARRGLGHGDGWDNGGVATTGKDESENKEERVASGVARVMKTTSAPARSDFSQPGSMVGITQRVRGGAAASWARRSCPWLDGRASQRGGSTVPHLSGHGLKRRRR
jgi:hypothetical protein